MKNALSASSNRRLFAWVLSSLTALMLGCAAGPSSTPRTRTDSDQSDVDRRASVRMELASGYFSRGQYATALDEIKQALAVKPDLREAINLRNLVYAAMGENDIAEEGFRRALSVDPRDADTAHNYGWFLCQLGRYLPARAQFEHALAQQQYRNPGRTYLAMGVCDARSGDLALSEKHLVRAFELDPANPSVSLNLAEVLQRQGQLERARFYVRRVNAQAELSNAQSLWLELRIERRLGNTVSVDELSQQLRKRYPQAPETEALVNGRFDG